MMPCGTVHYHTTQTGFRTKHMDPDVLYRLAQVGFDCDDRVTTGGKDVQAYLEDLSANDPITHNDDQMVWYGVLYKVLEIESSRSCQCKHKQIT